MFMNAQQEALFAGRSLDSLVTEARDILAEAIDRIQFNDQGVLWEAS